MKENFNIRLLEGLNDLEFGSTEEEVLLSFGEPEEIETVIEEDGIAYLLWHYWSKGCSVFYQMLDVHRFCCVEIDSNNSLLFDQYIFYKSESEIIELFKENDFTEIESEDLEDGEKRLTFPEAIIDLYF